MREKLEKIVAAYGELEAKMGDPAVVSNQSEYNKLAKDYANQGELARAAKEYLGLMDDLAAAKEMLGDADHEGVRPGRDREHRSAHASARRGYQVHAHPVRSGRREGHHRRDPRRCRWR